MTSPIDVSQEHYALIGKVASNWALFETSLDFLIWKIAKVPDKTGACLTTQIAGAARKLDAIIALVRLNRGDEKLISQLNKLAETQRGLAERRNRVVHDHWIQRGGEPFRLEMTARKVLKFEPVKVSAKELGDLADEIMKMTNNFWEFSGVLRVAPSPDRTAST